MTAALYKQDNFSAHGDPLGEEELQATKKALGLANRSGEVLPARGLGGLPVRRFLLARKWREWRKKFDAYNPGVS